VRVSMVGVGQLNTSREKYLKMKSMRSMFPGFDDRWRGGRRGSCWLTVGVLEYHRGIRPYDLGGM
jgi:hypothetical protein